MTSTANVWYANRYRYPYTRIFNRIVDPLPALPVTRGLKFKLARFRLAKKKQHNLAQRDDCFCAYYINISLLMRLLVSISITSCRCEDLDLERCSLSF